MSMTASVVMLMPDALRDKANRLGCALGHDASPLPGNTFLRGLSADGSEPATHWGCHTWADQSFLGVLGAAQQGALPPVAWGDFGLTSQDVADVVAALIVSVDGIAANPRAHWATALAANELVPVIPPPLIGDGP